MDNFFHSNNPFWGIMDKVFDIFILNVLWIIFSIPIVTIGPSTTAFYFAMMNLLNNEEHYITKDFISCFKNNFRRTFKIGLLLTAINLFLIFDIYLCYKSGTGIYTFFMVFFSVILLLMFFVTIYTYAIMAQLEKSTKDSIMLAYILSIKHLGKSLLMLLFFVFGLWICHLLPGLIFLMIGLVGAFHSWIFLSILSPCLPPVSTNINMEDISNDE